MTMLCHILNLVLCGVSLSSMFKTKLKNPPDMQQKLLPPSGAVIPLCWSIQLLNMRSEISTCEREMVPVRKGRFLFFTCTTENVQTVNDSKNIVSFQLLTFHLGDGRIESYLSKPNDGLLWVCAPCNGLGWTNRLNLHSGWIDLGECKIGMKKKILSIRQDSVR